MNFVKSARYLEDYKIFVEFTSGENGSVDLKDTVFRYEAATEIRDINKFREFYLDDWPTIGFIRKLCAYVRFHRGNGEAAARPFQSDPLRSRKNPA